MSDVVEILIASDNEGNRWTCSAWDPRNGTTIMSYKGGGAAANHSFSMINDHFFITANSSKPLLHVWATNKQEQVTGIRFVTPGKVSALAVTSDGKFLIAGAQETIYVWQICSGKLLNALSKHFQTVTTIKITDDNSHFVSGGQDGAALVWNLTKVASGHPNPFYTFNEHALPITDLHIGRGGWRTTLCTVSLDRSCRFYDLVTGDRLLNLVHDEPLTAVCLNTLENDAFIGTLSGVIYHYYLSKPPRMKEYHMEDKDYNNKFLGHNGKAVTCIDLSLDHKILASGGQDFNVCIWDIPSKQLLRTLTHKGSITNLKFMLTVPDMFNPENKYELIAANLKRMKDNEETSKDDIIEILIPETAVEDEDDIYNENNENGNYVKPEIENKKKSKKFKTDEQQLDELSALQKENEKLKKINKALFDFSVSKMLFSHSLEINDEVSD